jgi:Leucine-rich repeat (LRR) protein
MPLRGLKNLNFLACEQTGVDELRSLTGNRHLQLIYCDGSQIDQAEVLRLKDSLPDCLVIYQSEKLKKWWSELDETWQKTFEQQMSFKDDYGRENIQRLVDLPKVEIVDNSSIRDLQPLAVFLQLEMLTISNTGIKDIQPLTSLPKLSTLNIPNNPIADVSGIASISSLKELNVENTAVSDLSYIGQLPELKKLNIAGTPIKNLKGLEPLENLEVLFINNTQVKSLKQIDGKSSLKVLKCYRTQISSKNIEKFKANNQGVDVEYY